MPEPQLFCLVDELESEYVARALAGMRLSLDDAGWKLKAVAAGSLRWDQRMSLLHEEAHSGENAAAAFMHIFLNADQAAYFESAKIPLGYFGGLLAGAHSVVDDSAEGAYLGTRHLADLGHQRIALLSGSLEVHEVRQREGGYRRALLERSLPVDPSLCMELPKTLPEDAYKAALTLLRSPKPPTAIFSSCGDLCAEGVYQAAAELKLKIPRDLSVLGYDDLPQAAAMRPPLSTIRQPLESMGKELASMLVKAAWDGPGHKPSRMVIKPSLVKRQSTAAPR